MSPWFGRRGDLVRLRLGLVFMVAKAVPARSSDSYDVWLGGNSKVGMSGLMTRPCTDEHTYRRILAVDRRLLIINTRRRARLFPRNALVPNAVSPIDVQLMIHMPQSRDQNLVLHRVGIRSTLRENSVRTRKPSLKLKLHPSRLCFSEHASPGSILTASLLATKTFCDGQLRDNGDTPNRCCPGVELAPSPS